MGHPRLVTTLHAIAAARSGGAVPLAVFDLDGTLLRSGRRHLRILREFVAAADPALPGLAALGAALPSIGHDDFGYFVTDPLDARGIEGEELRAALERFWEARYLTSAYAIEDQPAPGAVAYVVACIEAGANVWYATSRLEGPMGIGTRASLRGHGFPLGSRATLAMRADPSASDRDFKEAIVAATAEAGPLLAQFENEPANAHLFLAAWPEASHFLVGSVRAPGGPAPRPELVPTADFVRPDRATL